MYNLYNLRKKEHVKTYLIFVVVYSAAISKAAQIHKKYYKKEEWRNLFTHNLFFPDTTAWPDLCLQSEIFIASIRRYEETLKNNS